MRCRRFALQAVALLALGLAAPLPTVASPAVARPVAPAHCDGPLQQMLQPAAQPAVEARAYWLDARHVAWPGAVAEPGVRYRIHVSAEAALHVVEGEPVRGADASIALVPGAALPADLAGRFSFIGEALVLQVEADAVAGIAGLLERQLLLVREDIGGKVRASTALQLPGVLDATFAEAAGRLRFGTEPGAGRTTFRVWAPTAQAVALCLYPDAEGAAGAAVAMVADPASGAWAASVPRDLRDGYYSYLVDVVVPGLGLVRNRVTDPYSTSFSAGSERSYIADLDDAALAPPGWVSASRPPPAASNVDMTIYELHLRDFSIGDDSVPGAHRGTYLAFTDADSDGMRHLRGLRAAGLTDIHLLPVFDIASIPERDCVVPAIPAAAPDSPAQQAAVMAVASRDCFNWGYDPLHYGAPEGSYSTNPADGAVRIREFRAMVQALHAAGLRVGMDVVYNHTPASGQSRHSVLDRIVPGYYQRLDAGGKVETSTCCANTATEHRMMAKLMIDTAVRWVRDYRIDSFRFDLMGHQPREAMVALQAAVDEAAGRHVALIGEGWNFGEIADGRRFVQAAQGELDGTGIATFSDRARDALRGGGCCDEGEALLASQGLLNGLHYAPNALAGEGAGHDALLHAADLARAGLAGTLRDYRTTLADGREAPLSALDYKGMPAGYAAAPGEVVNYVANHDNPTLWDVNALKLPQGTTATERARVQLLGAAFVAFSQGVAYFHAGMDLLRSKSLDRNSFDSGDWFNRLDWSGRDNGFGTGLPPEPDNGKDWALLAPVLRNRLAKPSPEDIAWMREAFRDLLRIRASSRLFRLDSAAAVQRRLAFRNVGPGQDPTVIVGHLDGEELGDRFRELLYLVNVSPRARTLAVPEAAGKAWVLHPVQAAAGAADARAKQARHDADGEFTVPGRTAVVYVIDNGESR